MSKRKEVTTPSAVDNTEVYSLSSTSKSKKPKAVREIPPVPNKPNQCHFFVKKKWRYCNMQAKKDTNYCGEHVIVQQEEDSKNDRPKRIPCPFDSAHTIFEKDLEKHKLKCNARPPDVIPEYYSKNLHLDVKCLNLEFHRLSAQSKEFLTSFFERLQKKAIELLDDIKEEILDSEALDEQKGKKIQYKHVAQQASLIGHLSKLNALNPDNCFIEFGAGKAELSMYVRKALEIHQKRNLKVTGLKEPQFLLIDRSNFRLKYDKHLHAQDEEKRRKAIYERLMIDIKDLDLSKVDIKERNIIAYSKHLCGGATDLTLKCLSKYQEEGGKIHGIVIALCCHHCCHASSYTSVPYLISQGIIDTPEEFHYLTTITSWATCGLRDHSSSTIETTLEPQPSESQGHFSGLSHKQREELGFQVKRLIDLGRINYLKKLGFNAKLVRYVPKDHSLENVALIAYPGESI